MLPGDVDDVSAHLGLLSLRGRTAALGPAVVDRAQVEDEA